MMTIDGKPATASEVIRKFTYSLLVERQKILRESVGTLGKALLLSLLVGFAISGFFNFSIQVIAMAVVCGTGFSLYTAIQDYRIVRRIEEGHADDTFGRDPLDAKLLSDHIRNEQFSGACEIQRYEQMLERQKNMLKALNIPESRLK